MKDQDNNIKRVTVVIAGRSYPVKVNAEEAMRISDIEKKINDQIIHMQMSYKNLDIQDCISMVLLTNTMSKNNIEPNENGISEKIDSINLALESAIS